MNRPGRPMSRRSIRRPRLIGALALAAAGLLLAPATASAQNNRNNQDIPEPPSIGKANKTDSAFPRYAVAISLGLVIIVINLIPSKRGHQD